MGSFLGPLAGVMLSSALVAAANLERHALQIQGTRMAQWRSLLLDDPVKAALKMCSLQPQDSSLVPMLPSLGCSIEILVRKGEVPTDLCLSRLSGDQLPRWYDIELGCSKATRPLGERTPILTYRLKR